MPPTIYVSHVSMRQMKCFKTITRKLDFGHLEAVPLKMFEACWIGIQATLAPFSAQ